MSLPLISIEYSPVLVLTLTLFILLDWYNFGKLNIASNMNFSSSLSLKDSYLDDIVHMYYDLKLSTVDIAKRYECSHQIVGKFLKDNGWEQSVIFLNNLKKRGKIWKTQENKK